MRNTSFIGGTVKEFVLRWHNKKSFSVGSTITRLSSGSFMCNSFSEV